MIAAMTVLATTKYCSSRRQQEESQISLDLLFRLEVSLAANVLRITYLEGQGDLVSRITPITHIVTLSILMINLLTKSP